MEVNATSLIISCDTCCMRATATCADCVVTHVLAPATFESVSLDDEGLVETAPQRFTRVTPLQKDDARALFPDPHLGQRRTVHDETGSFDRDPAAFDGRTWPDRGDVGIRRH